MKHHEQETVAEHQDTSGDGAVDAIAALVIVLCLAAMGIFWVSGQ